MKKLLYLVLFYCCSFFVAAQNVTITGFAPTYKGREITLLTYADYISNIEIPISTQTVNDSGVFNFSFQPDNIKRILLRTGKQKANLYVEPNRSYTLFFPARDTVRFVNENIEEQVDLTFAITDKLEINALVIDYNERFEKFWAENFQYFVQKRSRARLDSFELQTLTHYAVVNHPYFKTHITYNLAELDLNTFQSKTSLAQKYIVGKPIQYDNSEYMTFFNKFFTRYVELFAASKSGTSLSIQINERSSYEGCMEALAQDKFLKNDTLRELVLIKGLSELYYTPEYKRKNVLTILERIASTSNIESHQLIAGNVIRTFSKLQLGATAPAFTLTDKLGEQVNLSDFKGQYVYINFGATWCTTCLEEMKLIPALKKKYGDKVVFISINIDEDPQLMKNMLTKNPKYNWVLLHYGNQKEIKDTYEIKSVPSYFLVNTFGNFIQAPALRPTQNIESVFYGLKLIAPKTK